MASTTKKLKVRRRIRKAKLGKRRKAREKNHGTAAPSLALDKPTTNERAQKSKT